jgi:hypothetical protein
MSHPSPNRFVRLLIVALTLVCLVSGATLVTYSHSRNAKLNADGAGQEPAVNGQGFYLKLLRVRVFSHLDQNGHITAEKYDENGGSVEITVEGNAKYVCPGGSEKMRFTWRFGREASKIVTATGVSASMETGQLNANPPCSTGLSANSDFTMEGSSSSTNPFTAEENRKIDGELFFQPYEERNRFFPYTSDGSRRSGVIGVRVRDRADRGAQFAWFDFMIGTNAGTIKYVYLYEIVRDGQAPTGSGSGATGGCGWRDAADSNAPGDEGRGIRNWQAHFQYANGGGSASANVPAFIGNRMAILRACLSREAYGTLYALVSVRIGATGRAQAGWIDGVDSRAGDDPGRGISDAGQHAGYVIRGAGIDQAHKFVIARLAGLREQIPTESYARLYADLSVLIASYGDTGRPPG